MFPVIISAGEIPDLHVRLTTTQIGLLPAPEFELQPRDFIDIKRERDPSRPRTVRVMDVDWELAEKVQVLSADGDVFFGHVQDWDEDHGVLVIELD